MDFNQPIDYMKMFGELLSRRGQLTQQRDAIDVELVKIRQLILAIFPLLPEEKQKSYQETMQNIEAESSGLQNAIKLVFSEHKGEWLTTSHVRDYLTEMGFDFREYKANPLASIATTLKRMAPSYLQSTDSGSGTLYRREMTLSERIASGGTVPMSALLGKIGTDPKPDSAYDSGMRGDEKPKHKSFGQRIAESGDAFYGRVPVDTRKKK